MPIANFSIKKFSDDSTVCNYQSSGSCLTTDSVYALVSTFGSPLNPSPWYGDLVDYSGDMVVYDQNVTLTTSSTPGGESPAFYFPAGTSYVDVGVTFYSHYYDYGTGTDYYDIYEYLSLGTDTVTVTSPGPTITVGSISPATPYVTASLTKGFSATVSGGSTNAVTWSCSGGSFGSNSNSSGVNTVTWTASGTPGTYTITATSTEDGAQASSTLAYVVAAPVATSLSASTATPASGSTFTLTPTYSSGTGSLTWAGDSTGSLTCPATTVATSAITAGWTTGVTRTYTLTVTNAASDTATTTRTVTPQASTTPTITSINSGAACNIGGTYNIAGTNFTGTTSVTVGGASASYSVTNSTTISFTIPTFTSYGSKTVTVTTPNGSVSDSSVINTPSVSVSPSTASVTAGYTTTFTGTTANLYNTGVSYSASGGSITSGGVWTAPTPSTNGQSYTITATASGNSSTTGTATGYAYFAPTATSLVAKDSLGSTVTQVVTGDTFTLTPNYANGTGTITYSGGSVTCPATGVSTSSITGNWASGTSRTYTLTSTNAVSTAVTTTATITVVDVPTITGDVTVSKTAQLYFGRPITITSSFTRVSGIYYSIVGSIWVTDHWEDRIIIATDIWGISSIPGSATYYVNALASCTYRIKSVDPSTMAVSYTTGVAVTVYGKTNSVSFSPNTFTVENVYGVGYGSSRTGNNFTLYAVAQNMVSGSATSISIPSSSFSRTSRWSYATLSLTPTLTISTTEDPIDNPSGEAYGWLSLYGRDLSNAWVALYNFATDGSLQTVGVDQAQFDRGIQLLAYVDASAIFYSGGKGSENASATMTINNVTITGVHVSRPPNGMKTI